MKYDELIHQLRTTTLRTTTTTATTMTTTKYFFWKTWGVHPNAKRETISWVTTASTGSSTPHCNRNDKTEAIQMWLSEQKVVERVRRRCASVHVIAIKYPDYFNPRKQVGSSSCSGLCCQSALRGTPLARILVSLGWKLAEERRLDAHGKHWSLNEMRQQFVNRGQRQWW